MKSLGGDGTAVKEKAVTASDALRYAMSLPVVTTVSGIDSMKVLRQNLKIAARFQPFTAAQMDQLRQKLAPVAADGRYELYKVTARHDADIGRAQHGFPLQDEASM